MRRKGGPGRNINVSFFVPFGDHQSNQPFIGRPRESIGSSKRKDAPKDESESDDLPADPLQESDANQRSSGQSGFLRLAVWMRWIPSLRFPLSLSISGGHLSVERSETKGRGSIEHGHRRPRLLAVLITTSRLRRKRLDAPSHTSSCVVVVLTHMGCLSVSIHSFPL